MSAASSTVWNRACYGGGEKPRQGDKHLSAILHFHGPAMNGGVMHAIEFCSRTEIQGAIAGYSYLGLDQAVSVIGKAEQIMKDEDDPGAFERELNAEYYAVAADAQLSARFLEKFEQEPGDFAPVQ
jgi:hypothetical protein